MGNNILTEFKCDYCKSNQHKKRNDIKNKLRMEGNKYGVVKCRNCGLVSLFPIPTPGEIDTFYHDYASKKQRVKDELSRGKNVYPRKLARLTKLTRGRKLLDIGAGLGTFAFMAKQKGFDVIGIELSWEQCQYAKSRYNLNLVQKNI